MKTDAQERNQCTSPHATAPETLIASQQLKRNSADATDSTAEARALIHGIKSRV